MALTPPTIEELEAFARTEYATDDIDAVESALQQATDAFVIFTDISEYPEDDTYERVVRYGIMDLALWLMAQADHKDEINSPFSSERIGSYSYSKMARQVAAGEETGIWWLDKALGLFRGLSETTKSWSASENVMVPSGETYAQLRERELDERWFGYIDPAYDAYGR